MTSSALLDLRGISKSFGGVVVARGIDVSLAPGEALGVVGPNGAGKSSLFAMVSGDLRPDSGSVVLDGVEVTGTSAAARTRAGIGRTYQVPRPFEHLTVFENVLVCCHQGAQLRGRAAWTQAAEVLARVGLTAYANESAGRLGLLQRKRLEVARALGTGPKVLLLDEVAGGLTQPEVAELIEIVTRLRADGLSIVWIEHVVQALVETVDRMVCLAGGDIVADGRPLDVLADAAVRELYLGSGPETDADPETGPEAGPETGIDPEGGTA